MIVAGEVAIADGCSRQAARQMAKRNRRFRREQIVVMYSLGHEVNQC